MSLAVSPVSGKPYGLAAVCRVWRLARSRVYRLPVPAARHATRTAWSKGADVRCGADERNSRRAGRQPLPRVKVTARSGRAYATPEPEPRCAGYCG